MNCTKIFVINLPQSTSLFHKIEDLLDDVIERNERFDEEDFDEEDEFDDDEPCFGHTNEPLGEKKFGAAFAIDEPRAKDYCNREEFLDDHAAFDRFVDAGEDCVARGLERPNGVEEHRCEAIRKRVGETPPIGIDLLGETDWWTTPCCW